MSKPAATRQSQLAAIHIAQKALGMSADDAMTVKLQVTGQASAGTMTGQQRAKYLVHLSRLQDSTGKAQRKQPEAQRSVDDTSAVRWGKARAIWADLASLGVVHSDTDEALLVYVKRQTHMDAWRFLNTFQINQVIESLKAWQLRVQAKKLPEGQSHA